MKISIKDTDVSFIIYVLVMLCTCASWNSNKTFQNSDKLRIQSKHNDHTLHIMHCLNMHESGLVFLLS